MRRRFVMDSWCYTYAKWLLWQFGYILDKYLIKKEKCQLTFSKSAVDTPAIVIKL
jgi:hypothetical protein